MDRGGDAKQHVIAAEERATEPIAERHAFDLSQLPPTLHAGCTAAIEYLRICAAAHGSNPPPLSSQASAARAAMSAIGQHWQALVRASEK